ncbi:MAG: glycosyltransferase family 4 protein [bacterium]|nr:glycosyltransferase family 4 protein [bacterium]
MKIALLTSMKYGLTQFIFRDIEALMNKGHKVRIFTLLNERGLYNPLPDWEVIPVNRGRLILLQIWFFIRKPGLYLQLLQTALRTGSFSNLAIAVSFVDRMQDIDIIYAYFGDHKFYTGYYCKRIANIPLVVTIRAYELHHNPNLKMFAEALDYCDRIVTITDFNKNLLVEKYGVPANKIDIVRQIVDLEDFKYESKIKILIVGFFAEKKGHDILFKALKQLNRSDIELWVVGDMTPSVVRVDCSQLAKELEITSQVAFFGAQRDTALRALYRECDIFCLPSRKDRKGDHEGFPNVIAEAMAFSKPVISTRHAGIPEAVDTILVDENDVDQLAQAINQACESAELRYQLGQRNRMMAEKLFSPANNDRLEEILLRYAKEPETSLAAGG